MKSSIDNKEKTVDTCNAETSKKDKSKLKKIIISACAGGAAFIIMLVIILACVFGGDKNIKVKYIVNGEATPLSLSRSSKVSDIKKPERLGYVFISWFKDPACKLAYDEDEELTNNMYLYAKFKQKLCNVIFYSNSEDSDFVEKQVNFNDDVYAIKNTFVRPEYEFVGWSTNKDALTTDKLVDENEKLVWDSESLEYFAIWQGVEKTVSYSLDHLTAEGYSYNHVSDMVEYGTMYRLPELKNPAYEGNNNVVFAGFTVNGQYYKAGEEILVEDDLLITPTWQNKNETEYSVLYLNPQIKLASDEDTTYVDGSLRIAKTVQGTSYTYTTLPSVVADERNNYVFKGWNTEKDGSGKMYLAGSTFTTDSSINYLYGIWEGKEKTIIFNIDGKIRTETHHYGEIINLEALTKEGNIFRGWMSPNGLLYKYSMYVTETVELTADFKWSEVVLSINSNGGIGSIARINLRYGVAHEFTREQCSQISKQYHTLIGFSKYKNSESGDFKITIYENTTVYAIWKCNTVNISYVDENGTTLASEVVNQGETITLGGDKIAKDDYVVTNLITNDATYQNNDPLTLSDERVTNIVFRVVYRKYMIWFSGSGNVTTVFKDGKLENVLDLQAGDTIVVPSGLVSTITVNGVDKYFAGWSEDASDALPTLFAGDTYTITPESTALNAIYLESSNGVTFEDTAPVKASTLIPEIREKLNITNDETFVEACIARYNGDELPRNGILIIPSIYEGKPVVCIKRSAEGISLDKIKHLVIGNGITEIQKDAFQNATNIESVQLAPSLKIIGSSAFENIGIKNIQILGDIKSIGASAFKGCTNLKYIKMPTSLESIGEGVFENCTNLARVELSEGLSILSANTFKNCTKLTDVTIPTTVTRINNSAFYGCTNLLNLKFNARNCADFESENEIFAYAGQAGDGISITVGEGVTKLPGYMFKAGAAEAQAKLNTIIIKSNALAAIGPEAFRDCTSLNSVDIANLDAWCGINFAGAYSNPIYYAGTLYNAGRQINNLVISDNVTEIKANAFYGAKVTAITIGKNVNSIGNFAFAECRNVERIDFNSVSESFATIAKNAGIFKNIGQDTAGTIFVTGNLVKLIPANLLYDANNDMNITAVFIAESVKSIGNNAFTNLRLANLYIPQGAAIAADSADKSPIFGCPAGLKIYTDAIGPNKPEIWSDSFNAYGTQESEKITDISFDTVKVIYILENYLSLAEDTDPVDGIAYATYEGVKYALGPVDDAAKLALTDINIVEGTNVIIKDAFKGCTAALTLTIPESVTTIMYGAFDGCTKLTRLNFNAIECQSIALGNYTDKNYTNNNNVFRLAGTEGEGIEVVFGEKVTVIPAYLFNPCNDSAYAPKLKSVKISNSIKKIEMLSFAYCTSLTSIYIPLSVETIEAGLDRLAPFYRCLAKSGSNPGLTIYTALTTGGLQPSGWGTKWNYNNGARVTTIRDVASYEQYLRMLEEEGV